MVLSTNLMDPLHFETTEEYTDLTTALFRSRAYERLCCNAAQVSDIKSLVALVGVEFDERPRWIQRRTNGAKLSLLRRYEVLDFLNARVHEAIIVPGLRLAA